MVNAPFVIYADSEMMIFKEEMVKRGKVRSKHRHAPISVGALTVCKDRPEIGRHPFLYTSSDCIDMLIEFLNREQHHVHEIYEGVSVLCFMTDRDRKHFHAAHVCEMCGGKYGQDPMLKKVWDRCHISGKFRYALCSSSNLTWAKSELFFFTTSAITIHIF